MAIVAFQFFGYRKKVIRDNLTKSFPNKSVPEVRQIAKRFHQHFADVFAESLKAISIPLAKAEKHVEIEGKELLEKHYESGHSIILAFGHYANWEWTSYLTYFHSPFRNQAVYKPQKNSLFDRLLFISRNRFKVSMIPASQVARHFLTDKKLPTLTLYLADQWPANRERAKWIEFLGRPTAFNPAIERIAKKTGCPVLFATVQKLSRGKYRYSISELSTDGSASLTEQYANALEDEIMDDPALWLWSHRRWKEGNKKEEAV
jgi:KDO2-lipid IV(A) lauroyltransferase